MIIDLYTKVILTIAAVSLLIIALSPWVKPIIAEANTGSIELELIQIAKAIEAICSFNSNIC